MGTSKPSAEPQDAARLYLVTPPVSAARGRGRSRARAERNRHCRRAAAPAPGDERALTQRIADLRILIQSNGAALTARGPPCPRGGNSGRRRAPDRVPTRWMRRGTRAQAELHRRLRRSHHAARRDGWRADPARTTCMFGEPDAAGHRPTLEAVRERVGWWAEILPDPLRGLCGQPRRSRGIGAGRRGFRRAR